MTLNDPFSLDDIPVELENEEQKKARAEALAERKGAVLNALSGYRHLLYKVTKWGAPSQSTANNPRPDKRNLADLKDANLITSALADEPGMHTIMLDIDVPATLIPSSTQGKHHLYIDVKLTWDQYKDFLEACAKAGVIEAGYLNVSKKHMLTSLRLPWVRKGTPEGGK